VFDSSDTANMVGRLKICDFGFAKQESNLNKLHSGLGTPHFCGLLIAYVRS
jgi:hypothetical protein